MQITESGLDNLCVPGHRSSRRYRRFNRRYPVSRGIRLTHFDDGPGDFRTRNICHDGMYIETGHTDLHTGQILTAALPSGSAGAAMQPFEVVVRHHTESGIGVLLTGNDIDLLELFGRTETGSPANLMEITGTEHAHREHCPSGTTGKDDGADSTSDPYVQAPRRR